MRKTNQEDRDLSCVESLLQDMSLKLVSDEVNKKVANLDEWPETRTFGKPLMIVTALLCLGCGFVAGRVVPESNGPVASGAAANQLTVNSLGDEQANERVASGDLGKAENENRQMEARSPEGPGDDVTETPQDQELVRLVDQGLFLVDGKVPVRKYLAVSSRTLKVLDPKTGEFVEVQVPVRKTIVAPSPGT